MNFEKWKFIGSSFEVHFGEERFMNRASRPVLRYPGGKWKCADWIISHFPRHEVYVEVFGGGASVLMRKQPSRTEIYNEIDAQIVNVFRVLRDEAKSKELKRRLELTPISREEFEQAYFLTEDEIENARLMIYRSFLGVGNDSVFRFNGFRIESNDKKRGMHMDSYLNCLPFFTNRLKNVIIENLDWSEIIKLYDSEKCLFYVDPPYLDEVCTGKANIYSNPFTKAQHIELAQSLNGCKGNVIVSGYQSELYTSLYEGWFATSKNTVISMGKHRVEKIWIKRQENSLFN